MLLSFASLAMLLVVAVVAICGSAISGRWIALEKGRSGTEGLILGILLGPLGVVIEAVLPEWNPQEPDDSEIEAYYHVQN